VYACARQSGILHFVIGLAVICVIVSYWLFNNKYLKPHLNKTILILMVVLFAVLGARFFGGIDLTGREEADYFNLSLFKLADIFVDWYGLTLIFIVPGIYGIFKSDEFQKRTDCAVDTAHQKFKKEVEHHTGLLLEKFQSDLKLMGETVDFKIRETTREVIREEVTPRFEILETKLDMVIGEIRSINGRGGSSAVGGGEGSDPLFKQSIDIVGQFDKASASLLQRRLKIGYARAARILDELEAAGYVGPSEGSKPREVIKRAAEVVENAEM
jgi:hypothetical protein